MNNPLQFVQMIRNPKAFLENMMNNQQAMQNKRVRTIVAVVEQSYLALKRNMTVVVGGQVFINQKIILR